MLLQDAAVECAVSPAAPELSGQLAKPPRGGVGIVGATSAVSPVPPPLCILVHPPAGVRRCGSLWCPGGRDRGTFVEM